MAKAVKKAAKKAVKKATKSAGKPVVVKVTAQSKGDKKQTKAGKAADKELKALKPGRRIAGTTGVAYTEKRPNRSDVSRKNKI